MGKSQKSHIISDQESDTVESKKSMANNGVKRNKPHDAAVTRIKVIGVGGAGGNAVSRMYEDFPRGVDLIVANTDIQDLEHAQAKKRIYLGRNLTKGLGTGMNPDLGRQAAEENRSEIADIIKDAEMVFITAGMGGGTGTGAAPIVAEIAKELGILTIAIVTKPFSFEGGQRARIAEEGLVRLRDRVDTLITIANDRIFSVVSKDTSLARAFEEVDRILKDSVKGMSELILTPGIINIDFADIKTIMRDAGSAMVGIGIASGNDRAIKAANLTVDSPLLENPIDGAKGILFAISGRNDLKMHEINDIANVITERADPTAKIIFGTYYDRRLNKGQIKVTLIAAGFTNTLMREHHYMNLFSPSPVELENQNHLPFDDEGREIEERKEKEHKKDIRKPDEKTVMRKSSADEEEEREWEIPAFLRRKKK